MTRQRLLASAASYLAHLIALIKKEALQRNIEEMEREQQQRLGQDAAATDPGPSAADSPVGKVKTLTVKEGLGSPCVCR